MSGADMYDPETVEALSRKCSLCKAAAGVPCVCLTCLMPCVLESCPNGTGRIVHHAREQAPPRGGQ